MKVIQIVTFTFYKKLPQIMNYIFSYYKSLSPTAPTEKQGNYKMAGELEIIDLPSRGKKNYNCNQCGFSCNRPSNLKSHMRVHSGEKPFVCLQCNYSCTQAGNLRRHVQTHSGKKPFVCSQCKYSCSRAGILKEHMRTYCCKPGLV